MIIIKLRIGEMSKLYNLTIHALRYYDEIGLLKPSEVDRESGYRYYDEYAINKLAKIKSLKSVGLSLKEIQNLLQGSIDEVEESYKKLRDEVSQKIDKLNQVASYLDEQLLEMKQSKEKSYYVEPQIINLEQRQGYIINVDESDDVLNRLQAISEFEKEYDTNADIFFIPTRLMRFDSDFNRRVEYLVPISRTPIDDNSKNKYILNKGRYAVIDHIGGSRSISDSYDKLLSFIIEQGLKPQDIAIEILIINSNVTEDLQELRTQIQIPILE